LLLLLLLSTVNIRLISRDLKKPLTITSEGLFA
jgi:hypothetical protein